MSGVWRYGLEDDIAGDELRYARKHPAEYVYETTGVDEAQVEDERREAARHVGWDPGLAAYKEGRAA